MGAKFSADAQDAQFLVRDKHGQLVLYKGTMTPDTTTSCQALPIPLSSQAIGPKEQKVQYMFFPSSNYAGKNLHAHTFYDNDCDTPANDVMSPEKTYMGKNINHMKQERSSNSNYFEFNTDGVNTPVYPKFTRRENGVDMPVYTKRSAYNQCTLIPYPATQDKNKPVYVNHNNVKLTLYTDKECKNEYTNTLDPTYSNGKYNVDDRGTPIHDDAYTMKYTNVGSTVEQPAVKTNAMYYRTFR